MTAGTIPIQTYFPVTSSTDWSYVSGRISIFETMLLSRSFFEGLLKCRSLSDARTVLAKTQYRQLFTTDELVRDYASVLDVFREKVTSDIFNDAPPHVIKPFFETNARYIVFRNLFLRASQRGASAGELEKLFEILEVSPEDSSTTLHKTQLKSREAPQNADGVARSLFLDSVVSTQKIVLALSAPEPDVARILLDKALLDCWSAVIRSRWNKTPVELFQRWFLVPEEYTQFINETIVLAETNPVSSLHERVSEPVIRKLKSLWADTTRSAVDIIISEAIRETMYECRMVPYGPEKVLAYLAAFTVEQENLRMCLATIVNGIESKVAIERFRREYA